MEGTGLKVENGLGLRSFPDDSSLLEVRAGEFARSFPDDSSLLGVRAGELALEKNPIHFFSMSWVFPASGRGSVLNRGSRSPCLPGRVLKTSWVLAGPAELRRGPQPAAVRLLLSVCMVVITSFGYACRISLSTA
jgi:hypothetical protein